MKRLLLIIAAGIIGFPLSYCFVSVLLCYLQSMPLSLYHPAMGTTYGKLTVLLLSLAPPVACLSFSKGRVKGFKKTDYSGLLSKREVKKFTQRTCIKNGNYHLNWKDYLHLTINPLIAKYNKTLPIQYEKYKLKEMKTYHFANDITYKRAGLPFITTKKEIWLDPNDFHTLIIGTTGSGKSVILMMMKLYTLAMSGESVIAIDVKGELSENTANFFKERGYNLIFLDFLSPENSDAWNPLTMPARLMIEQLIKHEDELLLYEQQIEQLKKEHELMYPDTPFDIEKLPRNALGDRIMDIYNQIHTSADFSKATENFTSIADAIVSGEKGKDDFWTGSAKGTIIGLFYLLAETRDIQKCNLPAVLALLKESELMVNRKQTLLESYVLRLPTNSIARASLLSYISSAEPTRKSIMQTCVQALEKVVSSDEVNRVISNTTINLWDIVNRKTIVFIKVHDEKNIFYPIVAMFISQLWQELVGKSRSLPNQRFPIPLNVEFDEFGQFPMIKEVLPMLTAGRSRGLRMTIAVQGYDQIEEKYGNKNAITIENNCMNTVYLLSGHEDTIKKISNRAGIHYVHENGKWTEKPIITQDKLKKMPFGEVLIFQQRRDPFLTRLKPYFEYGFAKKVKKYEIQSKYHEKPQTLSLFNQAKQRKEEMYEKFNK